MNSSYIKLYEKLILPFANTVIDPWTMMVESIYTSIAEITMPASRCPNYLTFWAETVSFESVKQI